MPVSTEQTRTFPEIYITANYTGGADPVRTAIHGIRIVNNTPVAARIHVDSPSTGRREAIVQPGGTAELTGFTIPTGANDKFSYGVEQV